MASTYEFSGAPVLDRWAPLNHKAPMRPGPQHGATLAPMWVPEDEKRRLTAYQILAAYLTNNGRYYVAAGEDSTQMESRREYGDPTLLRNQLASSILGRGARIGVDGAEKNPTPPNEATATPEDKAQFKEDTERYDAVRERLRQLAAWGVDEKFDSKVREGERKAVGLGDGVYWLTWSSKRKRARLRVLDPGFYFPVYAPGGDTLDYPDKVHLAWEYEAPENPADRLSKPEQWVRRITYELVDRPAPARLRYQGEDDEPATKTCKLTDAAWKLNDLNRARALFTDPFTIGQAFITAGEDGQPMLDLDLGIDFIPVVHIPHGEGEPWGESALLNIAHILDDLTIADTDAADAADVAGGPPIAVAGGADENKLNFYGPRTVWALHSGGSASVLDTSKGLASLHTQVDRLQKRAANNSRVPQEILGQVNATDVAATGVLAYTFGPFESYIEEERQGRDGKFRLILKFVQRLFIHYQVWEGPVEPANVTFGSALPSDVPNLIEQLAKLTGGRQVLSRATATKVLADAGFPIPDVPGEARRVEGEDFDGANLLYRSTRAPWIAADYLGLDMPEEALLEALAGVFRRADIQAKVRAILEGGTPAQQVREALEQQEAEQKTAELEQRAEAAQAKQAAAAKPLPQQQPGQQPPGRGQPPAGGGQQRGGRGPNQVPGARS